MKLRTASFMALLALVPLPAVSQTNPAIPKVGETIEVSIVNLDVVVTDKRGNRVPGLTKDDFEVLEDGKQQQISNFSEYGSQSPSSVTSSSVRANAQVASPAPRQPRTIVLFVDDMRLPDFKINPVFNGIKKLLHEVVQPGDSVMILRWRLRPVMSQAPTDDLGAVDRALDVIAASSIGVQRDQGTEMRDRQAEVKKHFEDAAQMWNRERLASGRGGADGAVQVAAAGPAAGDDDPTVLFEPRSAAEIALYEMKEKVKALNSIVTTMAGSSGKKVLVVVSHRLGAYAGGEYFYAIGNRIPDEDRNRYNTTGMIQSLIENANAHAVTIYTVFPEGLDTAYRTNASVQGDVGYSGTASGDAAMMAVHLVLLNETTSLQRLAEETGGSMAWSAVDIVKKLPRVRDDFESYYSLAYRIGARHDDASHKVVVRAKNRDYSVRSRKQYIDKSDVSDMHDRVLANLLQPSAEQAAIPLRMTVGSPLEKRKNVWSLPIRVEFPLSSLGTVPDGDQRKGSFSVYIASGRLFGSSVEVTRQTMPFSANREHTAVTFAYEFELLTDLLSDKVSVGIYDEISHEKGFAIGELPTITAARSGS
jgi:VWFA-related protein